MYRLRIINLSQLPLTCFQISLVVIFLLLSDFPQVTRSIKQIVDFASLSIKHLFKEALYDPLEVGTPLPQDQVPQHLDGVLELGGIFRHKLV